jgi:tRNA (guanine37-N1)-methyltransferase
MRIDVLTLFPEMFESPLSYSITKRAQEVGIVDIVLTNIRDFSTDNYRKVDDKPYGGGPGMVMMAGPVFDCFEHVQSLWPEKGRAILLTPQGRNALFLSPEDTKALTSESALALAQSKSPSAIMY